MHCICTRALAISRGLEPWCSCPRCAILVSSDTREKEDKEGRPAAPPEPERDLILSRLGNQ